MNAMMEVRGKTTHDAELRTFPREEMVNEAVFNVIKVLRPDLLNDSKKVLLADYARNLKGLLGQYIS